MAFNDIDHMFPLFTAMAAQPEDTPTSIKVRVLRGKVPEMSKLAALPEAQLATKRSVGQVWLWLVVRSL